VLDSGKKNSLYRKPACADNTEEGA
jgi:hypothetical protein